MPKITNDDDMIYSGLDLGKESAVEIHQMAQIESDKSVKILLFEAAIDKYGAVASSGLAYCLAEFGSFMNLESFITRALEMLESIDDWAILAFSQAVMLLELDRQRVGENYEFYRVDEDDVQVPEIDQFVSSREHELLLKLEQGCLVFRFI
jgi:hypothetical protein